MALAGVLVLRILQLLAIAWASAAQKASGPVSPDGDPFDYFVFDPSPAGAGLPQVLTNWDGQWYARIATLGYPQAADVQSANDAWTSAFPPGFPLLTRGVMDLTGWSFGWSALVLNTLLALAAAALLVSILQRAGVGARPAAAAAIGTALLPSSPVLVAAYSEALALVLLLVALHSLLRHRYVLAALAALGLSLTRPVAIAFFAVVVVHALLRHRAGRQRPGAAAWAGMLLVAGIALTSPWIWPKLAASLYGVPDATQFVGSARTDEVASSLFAGYVGTAWTVGGPLVFGLFVVVLGLVLGGLALVGRRLGWPVELTVWGVAYIGMVLVATPVTPGFFRYMVLAAPLLVVVFAGAASLQRVPRRVLLSGLVALCLAGQWLWIRHLFILDPAPYLLPWAP